MPTTTLITTRKKRVRRPKKNRRSQARTTTVVVKRKSRRRRNRRQNLPANDIKNEIMLVANPCHGPISRTIGDGAITERVRATVTLQVTAGNTSGYVVWFTYYNNGGYYTAYYNLAMWENASATNTPTNSTAAPFGSAHATAAVAIADPANAVVQSAAFARGKTHSACIQLDYVGQLSAVAGQVAIIKNLPLRSFFSNTTTTTLAPPTVDGLFSYASERQRFQMTGHEVIWRPTDSSSIFRTAGADRPGGALSPDTCWTNGVTGSAVSTSSATDADEMYGIAIAWKGLTATAGNISVNFVKVLSLELAPSGSSIESPVSNSSSFGTPMATVTSWLDKHAPGWQSKAANMAAGVAGEIANVYAPKTMTVLSNGLRGNRRSLMN